MTSVGSSRAAVVVLVSGGGTNLQAVMDACADPAYGVEIVAVGADRDGIAGLTRAQDSGIPTFVCRTSDHEDRSRWDEALTSATLLYRPDLVVGAGFMKILGPGFLEAFGGRTVNTHPALLPSFPGAHGVRDALAYGVAVTGCTCHLVDAGVDTGPIIAQRAVEVRPEDDEDSLHERIKTVEREMLVDCLGRMAREGYRVDGRRVYIGR
ncbi:phosphoribosylglycinamide formyltransferase-1 [Austwickia chelonae]|uniref:Phosphoribosylglycinamide formyltransferase n=1 Tax=Austwickia chelonae NBRC 105200 TaxID=1184607 RepID=K6UKZ7_9MICO|nr:phosphoribosylglycinamide formyltransferase [Austwickia chelonae]GAB76816.1 phosphoribosylglycinamide formyltransferase [Austwickia chelonae NBRC 105200]SEW31079.1 phosphoribosylglycinamide formyltransferase-1 [Austwickia chelonae]